MAEMLRSFYLQRCLIYTPSHKSVQNIHRTKYMPLRVEIEQQETLERNQIKGGLEKIRKDTLHLEKKEYASATVYGSASIATLLPTFIEFINLKKQERIETIKKHGAGSMVALMPYLLALDTESQA